MTTNQCPRAHGVVMSILGYAAMELRGPGPWGDRLLATTRPEDAEPYDGGDLEREHQDLLEAALARDAALAVARLTEHILATHDTIRERLGRL